MSEGLKMAMTVTFKDGTQVDIAPTEVLMTNAVRGEIDGEPFAFPLNMVESVKVTGQVLPITHSKLCPCGCGTEFNKDHVFQAPHRHAQGMRQFIDPETQ